MEPKPTEELDQNIGVEDVTFDRESADRVYRSGMYALNPERWERARTDIHFEDVVQELQGTSAEVISCPFHGRDSKPSFHIYKGTNDGHCFGCPEGRRNYDTIQFVARKLEVSRLEALRWLEKHFDLPPLADVVDEEGETEEPEFFELTFIDVRDKYLHFATEDVTTSKDAELAEGYIQSYFTAAAGGDEVTDDEGREKRTGDPLPLMRVLGDTIVRFLLARKVLKNG